MDPHMVAPDEASNIARGHKANISNPNTSEESKKNSQVVLDSMSDVTTVGDEDMNKSKNPGNVAGGLKAAVQNPNITEEGKAEAQKKLDNM